MTYGILSEAIRDGKIVSFRIILPQIDELCTIEMIVLKNNHYIQINFLEVEEYSIVNSGGIGVNYIECLKLFKTDSNLFYFSSDPYREDEIVSIEDNEVILSRDIQVLHL